MFMMASLPSAGARGAPMTSGISACSGREDSRHPARKARDPARRYNRFPCRPNRIVGIANVLEDADAMLGKKLCIAEMFTMRSPPRLPDRILVAMIDKCLAVMNQRVTIGQHSHGPLLVLGAGHPFMEREALPNRLARRAVAVVEAEIDVATEPGQILSHHARLALRAGTPDLRAPYSRDLMIVEGREQRREPSIGAGQGMGAQKDHNLSPAMTASEVQRAPEGEVRSR